MKTEQQEMRERQSSWNVLVFSINNLMSCSLYDLFEWSGMMINRLYIVYCFPIHIFNGTGKS